MHECTITKALPEDRESILIIKQQAHAYFVQKLPHLYQSSETVFTDDFFNSYFNNANHIALLAKVNGQTVGYALIDQVAVDLPMMKKRSYVYIQDIAVGEDFQNNGIATTLLKAIEKIAIDWKAESLELAVHSNNPGAIHIYNKLGFSIRTYRMEKILKNREFAFDFNDCNVYGHRLFH